jgi:hypothetical protein
MWLSAVALANTPPCVPAPVVVYPMPTAMCCLSAAPAPVMMAEVPACVQTVPSPALAMVPVPVDPPTAVAALAQDQAAEDTTANASATDPAEEDVLENAAFGIAPGTAIGPGALDRLGLGWGQATIGSGTLYPGPGRAASSGGFGGLGGFGSSGSPANSGGSSIVNNLPPININITIPGGTTPLPQPKPEPVPEPGTIAIWTLAGVAAWLRRRAA